MSRTGVWDGRRQNSTGLSQALEEAYLLSCGRCLDSGKIFFELVGEKYSGSIEGILTGDQSS